MSLSNLLVFGQKVLTRAKCYKENKARYKEAILEGSWRQTSVLNRWSWWASLGKWNLWREVKVMRRRKRASQVEAKVREKILQGRSSEVRKNVKAQVMGGPCEDFGFYAEENGKPLKGNKQSHDMIWLAFSWDCFACGVEMNCSGPKEQWEGCRMETSCLLIPPSSHLKQHPRAPRIKFDSLNTTSKVLPHLTFPWSMLLTFSCLPSLPETFLL